MSADAPFTLPTYTFSLGGSPRGFFCRLRVSETLQLFCTAAAERSPSGHAELRVEVLTAPGCSKAGQQGWCGRLQRLFDAATLMEGCPRTRISVVVTLLSCETKFDILHHLVNAVTLSLVHAQVELRLLPLASACFIDSRGDLLDEGSAPPNSEQMILVQAFGPSRAVLLLSLGRLADEAQAAAVLELLSAAIIKTGKELLSQIKAATSPLRLAHK